jgi:hypothetical protein
LIEGPLLMKAQKVDYLRRELMYNHQLIGGTKRAATIAHEYRFCEVNLCLGKDL